MLLSGCGQWYRCGRDRVAHPTGQENLGPQPQRNHRRQEASRKVSRRVVRPACIAGVRISRPNFRAPCGRTKL